jgi:4-amino-4-deoxy-L-arabinose transferase-like glycosyltransferase
VADVSQPSTFSRNTVVLSNSRALAIALSLLAVCLTWFGNTGYRVLSEPDEGRYAEIPREMLASGDWVTPRLNGIPYLEKPPLQYWATAIGYSTLGLDHWVSRLWAVTLGLLGVGATYMTARTLWTSRAGEFAALILMSCPLYFVVGHINTLDIGLSFFMNAALACFLMAERATFDRVRRHWMWTCWLALAGGFLQKGLVALVLPAATLVAYALVYREWQLWRRLHLVAGLLILAVLCVPWLVLVSRQNPDFLHFFFIREHFDRFATTMHNRGEPWWYFIAVLSVGVLPWIVTMLRSLLASSSASTGLNVPALLAIWVATQLVFFSLSGSKLATYIVSAVPPLALLAGQWLDRHATARKLWPAAIMIGLWSLLFLFSKPLITHFMRPGEKQLAYLEVSCWGLVAGIVGVAGVIAAVMSMRRDDLRTAMLSLGGGFTIALAILMCGSNSLGTLRARPGLAAAIAPHLTPDASFYCIGMYLQALPFDLRHTCKLVEYTGEHELKFDPEQRHWLPSMTAFARHWQQQSSAVAIVSPYLLPALQAAGVTPRTILQDDDVAVIVKP